MKCFQCGQPYRANAWGGIDLPCAACGSYSVTTDIIRYGESTCRLKFTNTGAIPPLRRPAAEPLITPAEAADLARWFER